jgi:hypothetical protein
MNKKKIIAFFSVLTILIASVLTGCKSQEDRQKAVIQAFGIHETEDVSIENYDDDFGLWHDQSINLSTQKDLEQFADENLMVPVTITDETDPPQKDDPEVLYREISFKYRNGNQEIYGKFFISNNGGINKVLLLIYG